MDKEFKSGFVSMMGRTNVGKSSIMNALVNEKVAAIANTHRLIEFQILQLPIFGVVIIKRRNSKKAYLY